MVTYRYALIIALPLIIECIAYRNVWIISLPLVFECFECSIEFRIDFIEAGVSPLLKKFLIFWVTAIPAGNFMRAPT